MDRRTRCLGNLLRLAFFAAVLDRLQGRLGTGRGMSCRGAGCRLILLLIFALLVCGTCAFTDWLNLF